MSDKERSKCVVEALSALINQQPFFAVILFDKMEIVESARVPTLGTDGVSIFVNTEWFKELNVQERMFVLAHEVLHAVYQHMQRSKLYMDRGVGPDLKKFSFKRMNHAADYVINAALIDAHVGKMPLGDFAGLYNPDIKATDLVDDVYCKIPEPPEDNTGSGQRGSGTGNQFDDHIEPPPGSAPPSESEVKRMLKSAVNAAKAQGKLHSSLERMVDGLIEPVVDWKELLKQELEAGLGRDTTSWNKPNRRRMAMAPHVIMPGPVGFRSGQCSAVLDTSGSISERETQLFLSEVAGILSLGKPEACRVIWCDSKVAGVDEVEDPSELLSLKAKGGGGTDMQEGIKYAAKHYGEHQHTIVILTDMYTDFSETSPVDCRVIWVSTTKDKVAPYGTTIYANMHHEEL